MMTSQGLVDRYCATRSVADRNALVEAHRHLCVRGARKFKRAYNERSDLEQVAAVGLIKAAEYYRLELETPFEAYAWIMIVGELMHYVRDHERLVRVPRRLRTLEKRAAAFWDAFTAANHREPSGAETAAALGVPLSLLEEARLHHRPESARLPDPASTDSPERVDLLAATELGLSVDERVAVAMAIDQLAERERTIVVGTFRNCLTQSEIGERLGLSQSHVSKILARALLELRQRVA